MISSTQSIANGGQMAIADIFVGRRIEHPTKLSFSCLRRTSAAAGLDKDSAGQWHLAFTRDTNLLKELRQVSGGSDPTSAIHTMNIGLRMNGKDNAAL